MTRRNEDDDATQEWEAEKARMRPEPTLPNPSRDGKTRPEGKTWYGDADKVSSMLTTGVMILLFAVLIWVCLMFMIWVTNQVF